MEWRGRAGEEGEKGGNEKGGGEKRRRRGELT